MNRNPLKTIFENNELIKELKEQIKDLEAESQKCLDYAMKNGIVESGTDRTTKYILKTAISTRREPIPAMVWKKLGDDAKALATFQIKGLEKVLSQTQIDEVCRVNETVKRVVEKVE